MPSRQSLIRELLDESVRARRRRLYITRRLGARLLGLKTVDAKLDRNVRALAVFGEDALRACTDHLNDCRHPQDRDALVHLSAACAVQMRAPKRDLRIAALLDAHLGDHRTALRDALWFFPAGHGPFDLRTDHVAALLQADSEAVQLLGIELAGRLGVLTAVPQLGRWAQANQDGLAPRASELALSRLGLPLATLPARVQALSRGSPEDLLHALRLIAATGQTGLWPFATYLRHVTSAERAIARLAWCLATLADPAAAHVAAMASVDLGADLRHRVLALAGYPQGLITIAGGISRQGEPVSVGQLDALVTLLGAIPMEVNAVPTDPARREDALRKAVLATFRAAHVGVTNDADRCAWEPAAMLAEPDLRKSPRLRFGRGIAYTGARRISLGEPLHLMTPLMCRALYIEQSVQARRAFARDLSAYAPARTQLDAIGMSGWLEDEEAA